MTDRGEWHQQWLAVSVDGIATGILWLVAFGPGIAAAVFVWRGTRAWLQRRLRYPWLYHGGGGAAGCLAYLTWGPVGTAIFYFEFWLLGRVF